MVFPALYCLGAPLMGRLLDRFPTHKVMSGAVLVMAAGLLALSLVNGLIAFLAIVAFTIALQAQAARMAAASKVIARWFPTNRGPWCLYWRSCLTRSGGTPCLSWLTGKPVTA
ncbi:MFS transporter [Arthrobacter sp. SD76]|uniref:MFS transporter n=1 Tax=Arthrobacter sp. SD76 TaxID=3415007 RepID=UPI003C7946FA